MTTYYLDEEIKINFTASNKGMYTYKIFRYMPRTSMYYPTPLYIGNVYLTKNDYSTYVDISDVLKMYRFNDEGFLEDGSSYTVTDEFDNRQYKIVFYNGSTELSSQEFIVRMIYRYPNKNYDYSIVSPTDTQTKVLDMPHMALTPRYPFISTDNFMLPITFFQSYAVNANDDSSKIKFDTLTMGNDRYMPIVVDSDVMIHNNNFLSYYLEDATPNVIGQRYQTYFLSKGSNDPEFCVSIMRDILMHFNPTMTSAEAYAMAENLYANRPSVVYEGDNLNDAYYALYQMEWYEMVGRVDTISVYDNQPNNVAMYYEGFGGQLKESTIVADAIAESVYEEYTDINEVYAYMASSLNNVNHLGWYANYYVAKDLDHNISRIIFKADTTAETSAVYGRLAAITDCSIDDIYERPLVKICDFDLCPSRFYLLWQDRTNQFQCQPFDGQDDYTESVESLTVQQYVNRERKVYWSVLPKWKLRTGWLTDDEYPYYESIFISPYLVLYDSVEDKSYFVILDDTTYVEKKWDNQRKMYNMEINVHEYKKQHIFN